MSNQRKLYLASAAGVLLVLSIGIAVLCRIREDGSGVTYEKQISAAERYYVQGDYDHAVIAYKAAIEQDKSQELPYQRLTAIYMSRGEITLAKDILSLGIANTNSPMLQTMWVKYFENQTERASGKETKNIQKKQRQPAPVEQTESGASHFMVEGQVVDAVTGEGVLGAIVKVREEGRQVGDVLKEGETDADGCYQAALEAGTYLAEVELEGYLTEYFELSVDDRGNVNNGQFVISPTVESGQIRIVLEWGSSPADLDSYLRGNLPDGTSVSVNFMNRTVQKDGRDAVTLDVDEQRGYGPETTTIHDSEGDYYFTVHDFRHEGTLGQNGASVKVYMPGEDAPTVIDAPASLQNSWDVLEIHQGTLTVNNREMEDNCRDGFK